MGGRHPALMRLYDLAWGAALPLLHRNSRLRHGWEQRVQKAPYPGPCDLWMQAASVGEALLAGQVLQRLRSPWERPLSVLLTTNTAEGMGRLDELRREREPVRPDLLLRTAYFPLDRPRLVRKALDTVRPRTVVLLESEMWPGFMAACRERDAELLVVNGRMSEKSLRGYMKFPSLFRSIAPHRVLAMSEADAARFAALYGHSHVERMQNLKFDRIPLPDASGAAESNPLAPVLPAKSPFVVLASVREQEEDQVMTLLRGLRAARPDAVYGLFPRHLQRVDAWTARLHKAQIPFTLRSQAKEPAAPGSILLGDRMGELAAAFAPATAAFVGGSLAPLGGQNFLEPLACGICPVVGPSWSNFSWVGQELLDSGLVHRMPDAAAVLARLIRLVDAPPDRHAVRARFQAYVAERRGGSETACRSIAHSLKRR
ncbi:MAG: glycosyltransferase N-terminal domain-containing protein [Desulfovibrio sp.]|nr:glycosyltransferase N-terminal domain-containing protein [Desulfovibrio sp.]